MQGRALLVSLFRSRSSSLAEQMVEKSLQLQPFAYPTRCRAGSTAQRRSMRLRLKALSFIGRGSASATDAPTFCTRRRRFCAPIWLRKSDGSGWPADSDPGNVGVTGECPRLPGSLGVVEAARSPGQGKGGKAAPGRGFTAGPAEAGGRLGSCREDWTWVWLACWLWGRRRGCGGQGPRTGGLACRHGRGAGGVSFFSLLLCRSGGANSPGGSR